MESCGFANFKDFAKCIHADRIWIQAQIVKNQNTKITEEEQSSMPAGLLNLQVQQIPRRNQKSSRGVRCKHMQVKSQQRQTITQTFLGLRGPFY